MWSRFLWAFAVTGFAGLAGSLLLILLADPLGVSPIGIVPKTGYVISDKRFDAPQMIASGDFDSFLVGTSTIHHVDPAWAEAAFSGRFATLAIHGGTPYELTKMMQLIGRDAPQAKRIIIGIDARRWCKTTPFDQYNPNALFPDWLYDENRINDFLALLNWKMLGYSVRQIRTAAGWRRPLIPANGYHNNLIDSRWSLSTARKNLYQGSKRKKNAAAFGLDAADEAAADAQGKHSHPDLASLDKSLKALPPQADIVVVVMPSHFTVLLNKDRSDIEQCKGEIAALVERRRATLIDFRIDSTWTRNDENFWDENHFRVGLAETLIRRIKEAMDQKQDAEDGVYRVLAGGKKPHRNANAVLNASPALPQP
jgi:hypothetical protein